MKYALNDLPDINRRIKMIIDEKFGGNVRRFSLSLGLPDSSKINRLFNKDKRTGDFPFPSCEIVLLICNSFGYTTDWVLRGVTPDASAKTINNINITKGDVNATNSNIIGDNNNGVSFSNSINTNGREINSRRRSKRAE